MRAVSTHVDIDFIELWVRDLAQTTLTLTTMFGFASKSLPFKARPDEEAGCLTAGKVCLVLRQGTSAASPVSQHVAKHGDGVGDVALLCDDVGATVERALSHGLKTSDEGAGAQIDLLGDGTIRHTVRERSVVSYAGRRRRMSRLEMRGVDHVAYCVPLGAMDRLARTYHEVFGLEHDEGEDCGEIGDSARGMRSVVLRSPSGITVVLTEPMSTASRGQTQHFLQVHAGAGVQHVAVAFDDLLGAVESLRSKGVPFLSVPEAELDRSYHRLRHLGLPWDSLRRQEILVDADERGLLFQLFTRPITDRSCFFFELVHRAGATGFGATNVRALFAAVDAALREEEASLS